METCKYNVHMFSGSVWVWHRCVVRVSEVPSKVFVFVFVAVFVFVFVFECSHVEWAGPGVW